MSKNKPRKAFLSRFKVTGTGKVIRKSPGKRHQNTGKSRKRLRRLAKDKLVDDGQVKKYKVMMLLHNSSMSLATRTRKAEDRKNASGTKVLAMKRLRRFENKEAAAI